MKRIVALLLSVLIIFTCFVSSSALDVVTIGDANKDNEITATDALITLQYCVGKYHFEVDFNLYRIDVNKDNNISVADALMILQRSVDIISTFPRTSISDEKYDFGELID